MATAVADLYAKLGLRPVKKEWELGNRLIGGLKDSVKGLGSSILGGFGLNIGAGLAGMVGGVVQETMSLDQALTRFGISASLNAEQLNAYKTELAGVSRETGIAQTELLRGAQAYVALTGDAEGATAATATFAKIALATGSSMDDIASTAAALRQNLKIDPADFEAAFSILNTQGKQGAVEIKELATEMPGLAAAFQRFTGGSGIQGLSDLGAIMQSIRLGFGTTAEAATGLEGLFTSFTRSAKKFQKVGVQIFQKDPKTGKQVMRNFLDIVDDLRKKGLSDTQLVGMFGRVEAFNAFKQIDKNRAQIVELGKASQDTDSINRDAATFQESSSQRINKSLNSLKVTLMDLGSAVLPGVAKAFEVLGEIGGKALEGLRIVSGAVATAVKGIGDFLGEAFGGNGIGIQDVGELQKIMQEQGVNIAEAGKILVQQRAQAAADATSKAAAAGDIPQFIADAFARKAGQPSAQSAPVAVVPAPTIQEAAGIATGAPTVNATTTINVTTQPGQSNEEIGGMVRDQFDQNMGRLLRHASAGVGK